VKGDRIAAAQGIPVRFLETIMVELRHAQIVESRRGTEGGYALARPPSEIALADVIRALDGPLASVGGTPPETLDYVGSAGALREVWVATRAALRGILENTTLADVVLNQLPREVMTRVTDPAAWVSSELTRSRRHTLADETGGPATELEPPGVDRLHNDRGA
jgi:Rrf2 family protein